MQRCN